jgi:hypothetical protein
MTLKRKAGAGVLSVALLAAIVGMAVTFSAFSSTTENPGNNFKAGTVVLTDDFPGTALISAANMKPGDVETRCLKVDYTGTLPAKVRVYGTTTSTAGKDLSPYLKLTLTRGTGAATACTAFVADADGAIYDGLLNAYPASSVGAIVDPKDWAQNDTKYYQVKIALVDDGTNDAQDKDAQTNLTFEARNN